ncbi:hypothetical protein KAU11_10495 [Candidatus Babeliales bacterium]|nr:hypothetical protein [Candidatus Babeliales bacterium]
MNYELPRQKVSSSSKTKAWFNKCAINSVWLSMDESNSIKPDVDTIRSNFELYDGIADKEELRKRYNVNGLANGKLNPSFEHFSTIKDRIDELVGEYIEKGTDYVLASVDSEAINAKLEERRKLAVQLVVRLLKAKNLKSEKMMEEIEAFTNQNYLSKVEIAANKILTYYKKANSVSYLEFEGFREALITAVTVFHVGVQHGRLKVRKVSPENIFAVRNGYSSDIRDAEIITEIEYLPKSRIIDMYTDKLTNKEINTILDKGFMNSGAEHEDKMSITFSNMDELNRFTKSRLLKETGDFIDEYGNIRVARTSWAGYRKIFKRKYYDENGDPQEDFVSEHAILDKDAGEEFTALWVKEWHEASVIGSDIVVDAKISEFQLKSSENPFEASSGYVGGFFNVGNNKAKSMVDLVKPYIYFRDLLFARIEDLLSSNIGKVITLDMAKMPTGWSAEKWYTFLKVHRIKVIDSFKEGSKGMATGKLAGQYNPSTRVEDLELGSSIGYYLEMIRFTDDMIAKVTGVTDQRLGAISSRELVGNVERSRLQSSLITEIWFKKYEKIILELYSLIIDVARATLEDDDRMQIVLDDFSYVIMSSLKDFKSSEFGLFPVNTRKFDELKSVLKQIALNAIPNGQMTPTQLIKLYKSSTVFDMVDTQEKLDVETRKRLKEEQEAAHARQMELIQATNQSKAQELTMEKELDYKIEEMKQQYKVKLEEMRIMDNAKSDAFGAYNSKRDGDNDGIADSVEIEKQKMINEQNDKDRVLKEKEIMLKYSIQKSKVKT